MRTCSRLAQRPFSWCVAEPSLDINVFPGSTMSVSAYCGGDLRSLVTDQNYRESWTHVVHYSRLGLHAKRNRGMDVVETGAMEGRWRCQSTYA